MHVNGDVDMDITGIGYLVILESTLSTRSHTHTIHLLQSLTQIQFIKATLKLVILGHLFYLLYREQKFQRTYVCV